MTWLRESPENLDYYPLQETVGGIWGNDLRHSNNVKDWTIRRRDSKPVMIGHESVSETAKASVFDEGLINLRMLKVQSGRYRDIVETTGVVMHSRTNCSRIWLLKVLRKGSASQIAIDKKCQYGNTVKLRETPVRNLVPPWNRKISSGTSGKLEGMVKTQIIGTIRSQALREPTVPLRPLPFVSCFAAHRMKGLRREYTVSMGAVQRLNVGGRNTEGVLHKIESVPSEMSVLKRNTISLLSAGVGELQEIRKYWAKRLLTPTKHHNRLFSYTNNYSNKHISILIKSDNNIIMFYSSNTKK
jgi:hypothetical protein